MRIQKVLVGMDFSDAAIAAATWASRHFAPGAEMILAHVIDPPDRPLFGRIASPPADVIEAVAREYATNHLHEVATSLTPGTPRCEIRIGKPHEQLAGLARETSADLVVIGPHGNRPGPSRFLGTTAERTVRTSPVPVIVATNPPARPPRNILVPVDEAAITPALLGWARDLADHFDATITLLHVWSNAVYSHVASMSYATTSNEAEARAEVQRELADAGAHWLEDLARTGMEPERVTVEVAHGNPGDVAVEMAATMNADLIIVGRRGSGLVAPAFLGSTVGTVLHGARCPVLVVTEAVEPTDD